MKFESIKEIFQKKKNANEEVSVKTASTSFKGNVIDYDESGVKIRTSATNRVMYIPYHSIEYIPLDDSQMKLPS